MLGITPTQVQISDGKTINEKESGCKTKEKGEKTKRKLNLHKILR